MRMRATHRVEGRLSVEAAPEVFLVDGDDRLTMSGTLWKADYRIEEYDGDNTVEVSDEQLVEAQENSARWGSDSRAIRVVITKARSSADTPSPER
ncbi:hypothetical protein [Rhodococcus pyridinivorans]|uniref:hypothetical protein n=1 Tax=Rhodococcus pyridinivorans TaxID=103816 RepID=UPI00110F003F|nr:hypothetical protein [Rhodococcus pyridinivorans]